MKNTNMIRLTRGMMLAGLVLGSSVAQAGFFKKAKVAVAPVVAQVLPKKSSFFADHKLGLGLGAAAVGLSTFFAITLRNYRQAAVKASEDGKTQASLNEGLEGTMGYFKYLGRVLSCGFWTTKDAAVNATYATGRGIATGANKTWTGTKWVAGKTYAGLTYLPRKVGIMNPSEVKAVTDADKKDEKTDSAKPAMKSGEKDAKDAKVEEKKESKQ